MDHNQPPYNQSPYNPPPYNQPPYSQPPYQPQPPYSQPPYQYPQQPGPSKGAAVASMILGIVSLLFFWSYYFAVVPMVLGIIAIVLGAKAQKEMPLGSDGRGMATAGLIMGIIGAGLSAVVFLCSTAITCSVCSAVPWATDYYNYF